MSDWQARKELHRATTRAIDAAFALIRHAEQLMEQARMAQTDSRNVRRHAAIAIALSKRMRRLK